MFWALEIAKILISTVEISSTLLLALSIYRFPLRYTFGKVIAICFIMSVVGTLMRDWIQLFNFATLAMLATEFILTMLLFRLPAFFSVIVCVPHYWSPVRWKYSFHIWAKGLG